MISEFVLITELYCIIYQDLCSLLITNILTHHLPPCPLIIQKSLSGNAVNQLLSLLLSLINKIPVRLPLALDHVQVTSNLQKSSLLARIKEDMDSGKACLLSEADTECHHVRSGDFYAVINDQPITEKAAVCIVIMWIFGSPE